MVEKVNTAVIGAGFMGELHARAYSENPEAELKAIVDVDEKRAKEIANQYGVSAWYTQINKCLENSEIDAVSIATPEQEHRGNALQVIEAGKHILLEKPMAHQIEEAKAILEASKSANIKLMIGYILRFDPRYIQGRELVLEKGQDQIVSLYARRRAPISVPQRVSKWTHPLFYMGVHDIDMMRWYTGQEVKSVYATSASKVLKDNTPDVFLSTLQFENGVVGQMETNWILPVKINAGLESRFEVVSAGNFTLVDIFNQGVMSCSAGEGYHFPDVLHWPTLHGQLEGDCKREIEHFLACIIEDREPLITGLDGLKSLEIALALIESSKNDSVIQI